MGEDSCSYSELKSDEYPFVSVIMPVRNEEKYIFQSLSAILNQTYSNTRMEILIIDGMSMDRTRQIISDMSKKETISIRIIDNPHKIAPKAMNIGIKEAKGDIILRVDGHAVIDNDYIEKCIECIIDHNCECAGGAVDSIGLGYLGKAISFVMASKFGMGGAGFRTSSSSENPKPTDTVPFGAYRREVFKKIGLFHEDMVRHQDYEFCYRLRKSGGEILLLPNARASYFVRDKFFDLCRQFFQYGIWKGRFLRSNPLSMKIRHMIPPLYVIVFLASSVGSLVSTFSFWLFFILLSSYTLFIGTAAFLLSKKQGYQYFPVIPVILSVIHYCWGGGVWIGLLMGKVKSNCTF